MGRRWGRIIFGILGILCAVGLIIGAMASFVAEQGLQELSAEARGRIPGEVGFVAENRKYSILVSATSRTAADARCEARLANEQVVRMAGNVQGVSVEAISSTVGAFTAVAGRTTVRCGWDNRDTNRVARFSVARQRGGLRTAGWVLLGAGILTLLLSGLLLATGMRSEQVTV